MCMLGPGGIGTHVNLGSHSLRCWVGMCIVAFGSSCHLPNDRACFSACFALVACVLSSFHSCDRLYSPLWPLRVRGVPDTCKCTDSLLFSLLFCVQ